MCGVIIRVKMDRGVQSYDELGVICLYPTNKTVMPVRCVTKTIPVMLVSLLSSFPNFWIST